MLITVVPPAPETAEPILTTVTEPATPAVPRFRRATFVRHRF